LHTRTSGDEIIERKKRFDLQSNQEGIKQRKPQWTNIKRKFIFQLLHKGYYDLFIFIRKLIYIYI
jgi:hypothetical protein